MVTVGIPVYNAGKYLKNAIDSVLSQTYSNLEILITMDGATDNSLDIIKSFNDKRIRLIADEENRGIAFRLNQQVRMARGSFFARMDADDIMFPDRIEKQLKFMAGNPDVDVTGGQAIVIDQDNAILGFRHSDTNISSSLIRKKILFIHPTAFGRTGWFLKHPYLTELDGVEDYYLWNSTFSESRFHILNYPLIFYRDPPEADVTSYLRRQKKMRKALNMLLHKNVMNSLVFSRLYLASILKSIIFSISGRINMSQRIVSRRNTPLQVRDLAAYSDLLNKITLPGTL